MRNGRDPAVADPVAAMPSAQDLPAAGSSAASEPLETLLRQGFAWLRFPDPIEAQFEADSFPARKRQLVRSAIADILSFNLAIPVSLLLLSDISRMVWLFHGLMTLMSMAGIVLRTMARKSWQSNTVSALSSAIIAAGTVWLMAQSQLITAYTYSVAVFLFPVALGIAARLRFWYVVAASASTLLAYVCLMHGSTPLQQLIVEDNIAIIVVAIVFTLAASYVFEHRERRTYLLRKIEKIRRESLERTSEQLRYLSMHDSLTGLHNRRQFEQDVAVNWSQAAAANRSIGLLIVDVDFFKLYNDGYGHPAGDACLRRVASVLTEVAARTGGIAARLGGEEFGLLLPSKTEHEAMLAAQALCNAVRAAEIAHEFSPVLPQVTVSVGVASVNAGSCDYEALFHLADEGLYRAKTAGRNRAVAQQLTASPAQTARGTVKSEPGAAAALPADTAEPADPIETLLRASGKTPRFPPDIEADYQTARLPWRRRHLLFTGLLSLALFVALSIADVRLMPDSDGSAWSLPLLTAVVLLIIQLIWLPSKRVLWREMAASLNTCAAAGVTLFVLSRSDGLTAHSHAVVGCLFPMYAGMAARQPFRYTLGVSAVTLAMFLLLAHDDSPVERLLFVQNTYLISIAIIFTLRSSANLDRSERQAYLLDCQEHKQRERLTAASEQLHELSMRDPLTGLSNRRQFEIDLQALWRGTIKAGQPVSLLILDVDHFKLYNDSYGHPAGDACLRRVASTLASIASAEGGIAARLGGEEFGVLLPGKPRELAMTVGEKIRAAVQAEAIDHRLSKACPYVTVSVGAACIFPATERDSRYTLLRTADKALYYAKRSGRNRVAAADAGDAAATQDTSQLNTAS